MTTSPTSATVQVHSVSLQTVRGAVVLPVLVAAAGEHAGVRFLEFFAGTIRNPHTRRAYARGVEVFLTWCGDAGVSSIVAVQPLHVATWIELQNLLSESLTHSEPEAMRRERRSIS